MPRSVIVRAGLGAVKPGRQRLQPWRCRPRVAGPKPPKRPEWPTWPGRFLGGKCRSAESAAVAFRGTAGQGLYGPGGVA